MFPNALVTDTLQGNTSMPRAHYPNAFAMYFKDRLWNAAFCVNLGHENQHSPSSNKMNGLYSIVSIF